MVRHQQILDLRRVRHSNRGEMSLLKLSPAGALSLTVVFQPIQPRILEHSQPDGTLGSNNTSHLTELWLKADSTARTAGRNELSRPTELR